MDFEGLTNAVKYSKAYKRKKLRLRIVSGLAAVVIFITTYALILPAATQERPVFCGYTEHSHTAECLANGCVQTEHTHSDPCYVNLASNLADSSDWESSLPDLLSGVWSEDIISVAQSQLGYKESGNIATEDEATPDESDSIYTRYGQWYGEHKADWSSLFANFCLNFAGVESDYFPYSVDNGNWVDELDEKGLITAEPKEGNIVFFRRGSDISDTVGIISQLIYDSGELVRIKVIQGDLDGEVAYKEYSATNHTIYGYGDLRSAYDEYMKHQPRVNSYSDDNVTITATYLPSAGIPDGAELVAETILRENSPEEFEEYYLEAFQKIDNANGEIRKTEITGFRLYDIHFLYNGLEIQPTESVDIKISYPVTAYSKTADVSVVHYAENGTELPETSHILDESGNIIADFKTDSFSLFAIVTSETTQNSIISLSQYAVSSNTILRNLGGSTFAVVSGNYALNAEKASVVTTNVKLQNSVLTSNESAVRWLFESAGTTSYYLSTTIDGTKYYLASSGASLSLTETQGSATAFTAARSDSNITLSNGSRYINLAADGASLGSSAVLSLYQIPQGPFAVNFDGQLGYAYYMDNTSVHKFGEAENVEVATDNNGYIKLPTPEETTTPGNYPLKLNGWYDIINSVYYDSSMFGATIRITGDTTFYAEWIPETYDIGQNKNVVEGQPDTSGFIETRVFDYNELFNVHSSYYNVSDNKWYFDEKSELGFIFFDYICHIDWGNDWSKTGGNIGNIEGKNVGIDGITVNAEKTNGTRGDQANFPGTITPGIANEARLNALFGDEPVLGKIALGEGDWLYNFDKDTGYYYYNSAKNAASYNQSEGRFYVYDHTIKVGTPKDTSLNDFLPFNYGDPDDYTNGEIEFAEKNNECNYWFGMKSEITFYLPDNTGSGGNKAANGIDDMQFRFSGDDDVWIFVDGELALDLGGVHDMVYGEINFSTGKVKTGQAIDGEGNIAINTASSYDTMPGLDPNADDTAGVTTTDLPVLEGGKEHTLTIYYLERGSSLSNCAVYFNLSPLYKLQLTKKDAEGGDLLAGATFQAFADEECTVPAVLYNKLEDGTLEEIEDSTFTTDENGVATCWGLFAGKTYYIKEVHAPPGYSNMSEYVIEFTLSNDGESVFIMIDSNGTDWEFAGKYVYTGGEEHLIELDIYNHKYIGGDGKLYVEKAWAEGSENLPDEITVLLYANGEDTKRRLTLSAENDWKGFFYELPETDSDGNAIEYTVEEARVSGFKPTYEETTGSIVDTVVVPGYWEQTSITSGGSYYLVSESSGKALAVSGTSPTLADLTSGDSYQLWTVTGSGTSYRFYNEGAERYLTISRSSGASTSTRSSNITYSDSYTLYASQRYLYDNGGSLSTTSSSQSATAFIPYRWVEPYESTTTTQVPGWKITNTPWEEKLSIPIEKLWDSTVSESNKQDVAINLYLVTVGAEDTPQWIAGTILTSDNSWKGSFDDLEYPEDGSYYVVMEDTDEFTAAYGGITAMITVDNQSRQGAKVEITESGEAVTVEITNSALTLLPATGGWGTTWFIPAGILLIIISAILLIKTYKRIRI